MSTQREQQNRAPRLPLAILLYTTLILGALAAIVPILVVFFASFKTGAEYLSTGPLTLPQDWLNVSNYVKAFTAGKMLLGFGNTLFILVFSVAGTTILGSMVAYVLNRFPFKGSKLVLALFLAATLIPSVTTQVATFQIVNFLGLFNTRWVAILLNLGTDIISVYIFLQFLETIPVSLDEAAMLEGASYFRIYSRVILPLLAPAIATVVIVKGVAIYNDFYMPFLYMPNPDLQVVSTALFKFKGPYGAQWEVISAGVVIAIVPTLVAFLALQKQIYNGFTQGSVK